MGRNEELLSFAKSMNKKNLDYWKSVLFADKSKFITIDSTGRVLVRKRIILYPK